jgi:acyl dehydratase
MALDPSFVGRTYPPSRPYEVGREKIREFADAIGAADDAYRDPAAAEALGYRDVIAPPTFAIVVSMAASQVIVDDPELGLDYSRVVHGDQRFAYTRPVQAGDVLVAVCSVEEARTVGGMGFLGTRTDITTEGGEPVVSVWSRLVVRP